MVIDSICDGDLSLFRSALTPIVRCVVGVFRAAKVAVECGDDDGKEKHCVKKAKHYNHESEFEESMRLVYLV